MLFEVGPKRRNPRSRGVTNLEKLIFRVLNRFIYFGYSPRFLGGSRRTGEHLTDFLFTSSEKTLLLISSHTCRGTEI